MPNADQSAVLSRDSEFFKSILLVLPAIVLGAVAMIHGGVSPLLWGQQIAALAAFALLARLLWRPAIRVPGAAWCAVLLITLASTLCFEGIDGARRWLHLGVLSVNAAHLTLPALLVVLCRIKHPHPAMAATAVILCLQPDMSTLTAFCAASLVVLLRRNKMTLWTAACIILFIVLLVRCALVPITIEPVSYCEGILAMLSEISPLLAAVGFASLAAIPAFFLLRFLRLHDMPALCLCVYYALTLLFALSGEYPAVFMGFGLSPIGGYFMGLLANRKKIL